MKRGDEALEQLGLEPLYFVDATWEKQRDLCVIFPQVCECDGMEIRRVHPLQQRAVAGVRNVLKDDPRVRTVMLFGSSVNLRCTQYSDLDFAVRLRDECVCKEAKNDVSEKLQVACEWNADVLWYDELDSNEYVYGEILKGYRLYE